MGMMKIVVAATTLGFAALPATSATVHDIDLLGSSGVWTDTTPENVHQLSGEGTSEIRWGKPSTLSGVANQGAQSGYGFAGIPGGATVAPGISFALGTFTHFNNRIMAVDNGDASTLETAELKVEASLNIGGSSYLFSNVFTFLHDETPNGARNCKYGGNSGSGVNGDYGCNDRVTATLNTGASDELVVDGVKYTFEFSGFQYNDGLFDYFDTVEELTNDAVLIGRFNAEKLSAVPLPAAGWMLIAGLGGLAAMKRRKSQSKA